MWRLFLYDECACDEVAEELGDVTQEHLDLLSLLLRVAVTEPGVQTLEGVHLLPHLPNDLCKARAPNLKGKVNCLFNKVDNSKKRYFPERIRENPGLLHQSLKAADKMKKIWFENNFVVHLKYLQKF